MHESTKRQRRHLSAEQKVAIIRQHLIDKVPVSDLCDEHGIQPTRFYQWQQQLFEQGAAVFDRKRASKDRSDSAKDRQIGQLQDKLVVKNEVISELMEANIREKKANGAP